MHKSDNLYANAQNTIADFTFDESVVDVFPDMIERSIPGYHTIVHTIGEVAARTVKPHTRIYDIGCSLGAATLSAARGTKNIPCEIIGIDSSEAMVERCQRMVQAFTLPNPITIACQKAQDAEFSNASMIIMNFTLQFIPPEDRLALLTRMYESLETGGVLFLSEKIKHPTDEGNEWLIELHHQFKRDNGYSELEVSQKRAALEKVMLTDTYSQHEDRLRAAGFNNVVMWYNCFNFMSMIAVKN